MILPFTMGLVGGNQSASCLSALEELGLSRLSGQWEIFNINSDCKDKNWQQKGPTD